MSSSGTDQAGQRVRLLGPAEVRDLAARLGVRPAKRLGQNFVIDAGTIRRIVALADLREDDVVLEVGPGLGSLTLGLVEAAGAVVAVEVDRALAAELPRTVATRAGELARRRVVVNADALSFPGAGPHWPTEGGDGAWPGGAPTALVANLPYNVAVPVLLHLLAVVPTLRRAVVMVQAEVADRMCAAPGSRTYGVPSVKLAWYGRARRAGSVSRTVFWPAPNVDSALVEFTRWPGAAGPGGQADRAAVFAVIDAAFAQRRKTLRAALASWAGSAEAAERVLRTADVDPALRGEAIGVAQFLRIAEAAGMIET
jgi:16S rRNA (adenine1518-N6/adenine1519-N6)-dimethyltransferase